MLDLLDAAIAAGQVAADAAVSVAGKRAKLAQANFDLAPLHVIDDLLPDSFARACAGLDPALLLGDIEEPVRRSFHLEHPMGILAVAKPGVHVATVTGRSGGLRFTFPVIIPSARSFMICSLICFSAFSRVHRREWIRSAGAPEVPAFGLLPWRDSATSTM